MAKANTHLTHLEELVLTQGPEGYKMARAFLLELLKTLRGNSSSKIQTSVKWDGAPAIFAGINPDNGKFFVGTKSIFNKVPKINYTADDIIKNHGHAPGLVDKLTKALEYLPQLNIKNILQGDFMFDDEMIETVNIDGEPHYRFKPNTIVYAVPVDSDLGREIKKAKFGIVFHTTYNSLDGGASFGADVSGLRRAPGVWFDDAFFTDDTGVVTLTEDEEAQVLELVKEADAVNEQINYEDLPFALLNIYINSEIKSGSFLDNPEESFQGFINWFSKRAQTKVNKLKSEKGKQRATQNASETIASFSANKSDILNIFKVSRLLFEAKNIFIEKYNNAVYNTKHFVDDGSGNLMVTNPEGYVAVDHRGNGIKFVDRLEFSKANFAIDKGEKFTGQLSEEEFDIDDEDDDPVVDSDFPKTIAIVPGAFKPPHKGHLDMVRKYAAGADEVIVIISKPTKNGRYLPNGREITSEDSLNIWNILTQGMSNVEVVTSDTHASPINAAYEYVGEDGPLNIGDTVILGASTKDDDWKRWVGAEKYVKDGVKLVPPESSAVAPTARDDGTPFSATDFRNALGNPENRAEIADFVGEENVDSVLRTLGLEAKVDELSSNAGGGLTGGIGVPLASGSGRPNKKDPRKRNENIAIANEVMKLIKERGILR
jgi:cytidyltransferase-like protein